MRPSESSEIEVADETNKKRAIAYYRSSSEHQSEHSITLQQAQVQSWAAKNGIEIIREYSDVGKSGSICEERPAFDEMMAAWVMERSDFGYVLCVDASRIGRFQVIEHKHSIPKTRQAIDLHRRWQIVRLRSALATLWMLTTIRK